MNYAVLTKIAEGNSTIDMYTLQILQRECPILFDILRSKKSLPSQLHPVLYELLKRSNAPFDVPKNNANVVDYPCSDDSYFPNLPVVRSRGLYVADTARKAKICTKRGSSHPTLLPGIFTLFCSHGMVQYNTVIYTTSRMPNAFTTCSCMYIRYEVLSHEYLFYLTLQVYVMDFR